jgi:hypothetical protein
MNVDKKREYYQANKEKIIQRSREYYQRTKTARAEEYQLNKEKIKDYYQANRTKILEGRKGYYTNNKEAIKERTIKRRELLALNTDTFVEVITS